MNKIDPNLIKQVDMLSSGKNSVECLIYSNNFYLTKKYLQNYNIKEFPFIKAFGLNVKKENLFNLASLCHIDYITSETKVSTQINVAKNVIGINNFYKENIFGKNITVAVIDTGIYPHIDFLCPQNKIIGFKDFVNNKDFPYDDNGHGTFVSGIIGGSGNINKNYMGVAPKCKIISLKALNHNGETGAFTILDAMQWVYDNKEKYNIKVVCMSFGATPLNSNDPLMKGAEKLWNNGIVVVAAAGNSGPESETIKSPGVSSKIITVGALNDNRNEKEECFNENFEIADFSSRGPAFNYYKPDCVANGVNIKGLKNSKEFFTTMSGTSVATPIVAGVCALIIEKYPKITPNQVKYLIINNCESITKDKNLEGFGLIKIN